MGQVVMIRKERLEELRDALLDKMRARLDAPNDADAKVSYRLVHYELHEFVSKIEKEPW